MVHVRVRVRCGFSIECGALLSAPSGKGFSYASPQAVIHLTLAAKCMTQDASRLLGLSRALKLVGSQAAMQRRRTLTP